MRRTAYQPPSRARRWTALAVPMVRSDGFGMAVQAAVEDGEVGGDSAADLLLDGGSAGEPSGQRPLNGRVHGEEGVGDDFEAGEGLGGVAVGGFAGVEAASMVGAGAEEGGRHDNPGGLHLREGGNFAEAADDVDGHTFKAAGEGGGLRREGGECAGEARIREAVGLRAEAVIEKDFIDDEGEAELAAEAGELLGLEGFGEVAGGIVGVDDDDGARARRDGAADAFGVDLPAVLIDEGHGLEADVVEGGEEIEERVAGLQDEDFVAGVREQAEEKAVGFAGAGGEDDLLRIECNAVVGIVGADGLAGGEEAAGLGIVVEGAGIGERGEQGRRVGEAAARGIGLGEVGSRETGFEALAVRAREVGFFGVPIRSFGKGHAVGSRGALVFRPRRHRADFFRPQKRAGVQSPLRSPSLATGATVFRPTQRVPGGLEGCRRSGTMKEALQSATIHVCNDTWAMHGGTMGAVRAKLAN